MSREWEVCFLTVALQAVSGVRVGAGQAPTVETGTDLPVLRTPSPPGDPLIPGPSLKGVLRSAAERLLSGRGVRACDPLRSPCLGDRRTVDPADLKALCWVCQLFGSRHQAGRILVEDLVARGARVFVRDGVAIDRGDLKAAPGLKFDYEVIAPGALFEGRLRVDDAGEGDLGLLCAVFDLIDAGVVTVGGGASRGLGRLRLARPLYAERYRASSFRPGTPGHPVDLEAERETFERRAEREGGQEVGP